MGRSQNEATKEVLKLFANEWDELSKQALDIQNRKRELREILEPIFESIIPELNRELTAAKLGYHFRVDQHAGLTATGPISFEMYPLSTEEWRANDKREGWVDYDRAKKLTEFVNKSKSVSEFKLLFPHIRISVTANYCGYFRLGDENEAVENSDEHFDGPYAS